MLRLIVKGNHFQATAAAMDRGIPAALLDTKTGFPETFLHVSEEHEEKVQKWFLEHVFPAHVPPFPVGTLLHYGTEHKYTERIVTVESLAPSNRPPEERPFSGD